MKIIRHIPNTITCCNLLSGCLSIVYLVGGNFFMAGIMIVVAAVFDFFDGFAARLLNAKSPIGAELDSLCDVVSFGVAPSFIVLRLLRFFDEITIYGHHYAAYSAFLLAVFAAVRLAKFNIDTRQTTSFIGLPTPAMAIFVATLSIALTFATKSSWFYAAVFNPWFMLGVVAVFSFLMVSEIPFPSLKLKNLWFKGNEALYIILVLSMLAVNLLGLFGLPFVILIYIVVSLVNSMIRRFD